MPPRDKIPAFLLYIALSGMILAGASMCFGQQSAARTLPSVLVTPRFQIDAQIVDEPAQVTYEPTPAVQGGVYVEPQTQAAPQPVYQAQSQVIYVQPPVAQVTPTPRQSPDMERYLRWRVFNSLMFNATYEQRGVLFHRYVRRPDAERNQFIIWSLMNQ